MASVGRVRKEEIPRKEKEKDENEDVYSRRRS
jgi:hypothetical protein